MLLHLIRHAKTNQESPTGRDFDRSLLPKGIKQGNLLANYLKIPKDAVVYCSSAKRTRETFELISKSIPFDHINFLDNLYLCSRSELTDLVFSQEHKHELVIIGHNYGISDLASYFLDDRIELRTGEYIAIEFEIESWKEASIGLGTIYDRYRPRTEN